MSVSGTRGARAAIYCRVSHDPKKTGRSVEEQEAECRHICQAYGWRISAVFVDNNVSGYDGSYREHWEQLLVELNDGKYEILVVWEPSRATRDRDTWNLLVKTCVTKGVKIAANGRVYDLDDPDDMFQLDIFFAVAALESGKTKKRTRRAMQANVADGLPGPGKPLFGYKKTKNEKGQVTGQVFDEELRHSIGNDGECYTWSPADLVRWMFSAAAVEIPVHAISLQLDKLGIPNPRTLHALENHPTRERTYESVWNPPYIRRLLSNLGYLGDRLHLGTSAKSDKWQPLIKRDDFFAVANATHKRRKEFPGSRPALTRHLLTKLARCEHCKLLVQACRMNGKYGLRCRTGRSLVWMNEADRYVENWLMMWLSDPANIARVQDDPEHAEHIAEARAEVEQLEAELEGWKKAAEDLDDLDVDLPMYKRMASSLRPRIDAAETRARVTGFPPVLHRLMGPDPATVWARYPLASRRTVISTVCEVWIRPAGRVYKDIHERVIIISKL